MHDYENNVYQSAAGATQQDGTLGRYIHLLATTAAIRHDHNRNITPAQINIDVAFILSDDASINRLLHIANFSNNGHAD